MNPPADLTSSIVLNVGSFLAADLLKIESLFLVQRPNVDGNRLFISG